jgi:hypothetical protein
VTHTHEYDCKLCGSHLDSAQELDRHVRENHPDAMRASRPSDASMSQRRPSSMDGHAEKT